MRGKRVLFVQPKYRGAGRSGPRYLTVDRGHLTTLSTSEACMSGRSGMPRHDLTGSAPPAELVADDGNDNHHAQGNLLHIGIDVGEVESVSQYPDEHRPPQRARNCAATASQGGPAHHARGDHVEFVL